MDFEAKYNLALSTRTELAEEICKQFNYLTMCAKNLGITLYQAYANNYTMTSGSFELDDEGDISFVLDNSND